MIPPDPSERRTGDDRRLGWYMHSKGSEKGGPCPKCQHTHSRVYDGEGTARYRECAKAGCGARWVTKEHFERRIA